MTDLLIIGGASLDVLHFAGQTVSAAGGAGLYTAAAAARLRAATAMCAPLPDILPDLLRPAAERFHWFGPIVSLDALPRFEIAHYGGGKTAMLDAYLGAEAELAPENLPDDLSKFAIVHLVALGEARRQLDFFDGCRQRGARRISAGTFSRAVAAEPDTVRRLLAQADLFFMNESEATGLFGSAEAARTAAGKLLFVTLGERGALVIQGDHVTHVPGQPAVELDPTGAGDTFCGATLAGLARGEHPVMAARSAIALASQMIGMAGPAALWRTDAPPAYSHDPRVAPDEAQITRVAKLIAELPEVQPSPFTSPDLPPAGHPVALDYFFTATLQQFGFWTEAAGRYEHPLLAPLDGALRKGSDYLWHAWLRPLDSDPGFYTAERQAGLSRHDLEALVLADDTLQPMPALDLHQMQANAYGRTMLSQATTPADLVAAAMRSPRPLETFLASLDHVGGYREDPLRKKAALLALILSQRPEHWLAPAPDEAFPPIIDYHLMRSCLRTGLIAVQDTALEGMLVARRVLAPADEWAVRLAAYDAVTKLVRCSGRSMGAVDWFFFNARRRCPEMDDPECTRCAVDPVCAHRKALFQPVLRTVFY